MDRLVSVQPMKVTVATIRVPANRAYDAAEAHWLATYAQFRPQVPHELVVVDSDVAAAPCLHGRYTDKFLVYTGGGWDCGAWIWLAQTLDTDLLVCCKTTSYFWKAGWLDRLVEEAERHGPGVYGSTASYEVSPHIRTSGFAIYPEVLRDYPVVCDSRQLTMEFEHAGGPFTLTNWAESHGYKTLLVTWDGCYEKPDWRKPDNIFRRGDQSNILIRDNNVDEVNHFSASHWAYLAQRADYG